LVASRKLEEEDCKLEEDYKLVAVIRKPVVVEVIHKPVVELRMSEKALDS
jgi:hypothetical protein